MWFNLLRKFIALKSVETVRVATRPIGPFVGKIALGIALMLLGLAILSLSVVILAAVLFLAIADLNYIRELLITGGLTALIGVLFIVGGLGTLKNNSWKL